jgi:hypothetical protein
MSNVQNGVDAEQLAGTVYAVKAEPSLARFNFHANTGLRQRRIAERKGCASPFYLSNISARDYFDREGDDECRTQTS